MKIAFDGKRLMFNFTGLGNYSRYALEALLDNNQDDEFLVYVSKIVENQRLNKINSKNNLKYITKEKKYKVDSFWRSYGIDNQLLSDKVDIFHGLSNEIPLRCNKNTKYVVTIHDLIFRTMPNTYTFFDRNIYDYKYRKSCENADLIIAVSQKTKEDIIKFWNIDPNKIKVIYQGCDESFEDDYSIEELNQIRQKYNLNFDFVLCVGSIEERKNALLLIKSLPYLPKEIHAVLIGKTTKYTEKINQFARQNNLEDRVHILSNVGFVDLKKIYHLAKTFVYSSKYEGFGIPIVEALKSKIPVVACKGSCLEEAGGESSLYVDSDDFEALATAIISTFDQNQRNLMIEKGYNYSLKFTKQNFCKELMDCYKSLIK